MNHLQNEVNNLITISSSDHYLKLFSNTFRILQGSTDEFKDNIVFKTNSNFQIKTLRNNYITSQKIFNESSKQFIHIQIMLKGVKRDIEAAILEIQNIDKMKEDLLRQENNLLDKDDNELVSSKDSTSNLSTPEQKILTKMKFLNCILNHFYNEKKESLKYFKSFLKKEFLDFFTKFRSIWKNQEEIPQNEISSNDSNKNILGQRVESKIELIDQNEILNMNIQTDFNSQNLSLSLDNNLKSNNKIENVFLNSKNQTLSEFETDLNLTKNNNKIHSQNLNKESFEEENLDLMNPIDDSENLDVINKEHDLNQFENKNDMNNLDLMDNFNYLDENKKNDLTDDFDFNENHYQILNENDNIDKNNKFDKNQEELDFYENLNFNPDQSIPKKEPQNTNNFHNFFGIFNSLNVKNTQDYDTNNISKSLNKNPHDDKYSQLD